MKIQLDTGAKMPKLEEVGSLVTTDRGSNGFGSSGR